MTRLPALSLLVLLASPLAAQTSGGLTPQEPGEKPIWIAPPKEPLAAAPVGAPAVAPERPPRLLPSKLPARALAIEERVHFDAPGDGALWGGGRDYKVRFDAGSLTYFPRAVASPRNLPLTLRLAGVSVQGVPIAFDAGASAERRGESVVYARGGFEEVYALRPDEIEQLFVFERPPAVGEIVLSIAVETVLAPFSDAHSLRFRDAFAEVEYSRAVAVDAGGARLPLETRLSPTGIEIRVPAAFAAGAEWPLTVDPVITNLSLDASGENDTSADAAWDEGTERWIVVWEREYTAVDRDIYSVLVDENGLIPLSGDYIDYTVDDWRNPSVANNYALANYLVAAEEGADGSRVISARTRSSHNGTPMGFQFLVNDDFGEQLEPVVGGDPSLDYPTNYCVVWRRVFSAGDHDIHAQIVDSNGVLVGGRILVDDTSNTLDRFPDIAKSIGDVLPGDQNWNVVWQRQFSVTDQDIRGAQIHFDGTVTTPSFSIDYTGFDDRYPAVSSSNDSTGGPSDWVVAYQRDSFGTQEIHAVLLRGALTVIELNVTDVDGSSATRNSFRPSVDSDGCRFLVTYMQDGPATNVYVYGSTFYTPDLQLDEGHVLLDGGIGAESFPRVVANHAGSPLGADGKFLVVWSEDDGSVNGGGNNIASALFDSLAPDNDACAQARDISGLGYHLFDNTGAATDGAPILGGCLNNLNVYDDVWFAWAAPENGLYSVSTCVGTAIDTALAVYAGSSCPTGSAIGCNDDACGVQSQVVFGALQGHTVLIRVGGTQPGVQGAGLLRITAVSTDEGLGETYCVAGDNSTSLGAEMFATGSTSFSNNDLLLAGIQLPPNKPGVFYFGTQATQVPFGDGYRCVGGQTFRLPVVFSNGSGNVSFAVDYAEAPATQLSAGETWNFQFWYRDPNGPGGSGFNLSDGLRLTFFQ